MLYPQAWIIQKIRCIWFCVKVTSNKASKALSSGQSLLPKRQHTLSFTRLPWKQLMLIPSELLQSLAERNRLSGAFQSYRPSVLPVTHWEADYGLCACERFYNFAFCVSDLWVLPALLWKNLAGTAVVLLKVEQLPCRLDDACTLLHFSHMQCICYCPFSWAEINHCKPWQESVSLPPRGNIHPSPITSTNSHWHIQSKFDITIQNLLKLTWGVTAFFYVCVNSDIRHDQIRNSHSSISDSHRTMIASLYSTERRWFLQASIFRVSRVFWHFD